MKKLLLATLLAAGAMVPMAAQDLYFQTADGENLNGTTFTYTEFQTFPQGSKTEVFIDPELFIYSESGGLVNIAVNSNVKIQLCTGGGMCEEGTEVIKEGIELEAGEPMNLRFDFSEIVEDVENYTIPAIEAVLTAYYVDDPDSEITLTVKMGGMEAGVEAIASGLDGVNFNGNILSYDLNGVSQLSVYSLSGKTVLNKTVAGTGAVSLEGLSKGIYLYRVTNKNGKTVKSAKIIIK